MHKHTIRIKAMCLFENNGKVLVGKAYDKSTDEHFYRILGGSIHFGETSEEAIRREIREELKSEIKNLELINITENFFEYEGIRGHEIVFLFKGSLANEEMYKENIIHVIEESYEFDAAWILVRDILDGPVKLYPDNNIENILHEL